MHEFESTSGERKHKMSDVVEHNDTIEMVFICMRAWVLERRLGVVKAQATFVLTESHGSNWASGSRSPDVMFIQSERFEAYKQLVPDYKHRPYFIVPDMVVEVVSPDDRAEDVLDLIDAYRMDGVRLIWVIYPRSRKAFTYTPDCDDPMGVRLTKANPTAALDGGDVLPGFRLKLADLFA